MTKAPGNPSPQRDRIEEKLVRLHAELARTTLCEARERKLAADHINEAATWMRISIETRQAIATILKAEGPE